MSSRSSFVRLVRQAVRTVPIVVLAVLVGAPVAVASALAAYVFLPLPAEPPEMRPLPIIQRSLVYAADGTVIGEFRGTESRVPVPAEEIPEMMKWTVIAAEDHTFYDHGGIDWKGLARAAWRNYRSGEYAEGGSTITQQLVKNRYTDGERTVHRKVREAFISVQLERVMDKEEILARYLNTVYFGDSLYGIGAAARSYFRKSPTDLNLSEAALLAGVIPAPSRYSPRTHPELAEQKRQLVLDAVEHHGFASSEQVAAARSAPPAVQPPPVLQSPYPYFMDYLRHYLLDTMGYPAELLYGGGLRIDTTLDRRFQDHAQAAIRRLLHRPGDPESSLVAVEPGSGFVRALIGGHHWGHSKVNLALGRQGGGSGRQAGSAFKPFVLAQALDTGIPPQQIYPAPARVQPAGFDQPVRNYGLAAYGKANLIQATEKSINTVYAELIADVGVRETAEMARRLGVTSIDPSAPLYGSIALGSQEVSPLEMASAYSVFAARGLRADPTPVVRITRAGQVIEDNEAPGRGRPVLQQGVADTVNHILRRVITSGTGVRADLGIPAAGKTGTSQNYGNAWFVGYTPALSTAVWVGHREGNIPMVRVGGVAVVAGGTIPAQIWHDFMAVALENVPPVEFSAPGPFVDTVAERQRRAERGGIDPGAGRARSSLIPAAAPYYTDPPVPTAVAPPPGAMRRPRPLPDSAVTAPPSSGEEGEAVADSNGVADEHLHGPEADAGGPPSEDETVAPDDRAGSSAERPAQPPGDKAAPAEAPAGDGQSSGGAGDQDGAEAGTGSGSTSEAGSGADAGESTTDSGETTEDAGESDGGNPPSTGAGSSSDAEDGSSEEGGGGVSPGLIGGTSDLD